jgi:hypothetical protein
MTQQPSKTVNIRLPVDLLFLDYLNLRPTSRPQNSIIASLSERHWRTYLRKLDSAGMIFHFLSRLRQRGNFHEIPHWVQARLEKNLRDQTDRHGLITREFLEFNRLLQERRIRYICLKGVTAFPDFVDNPIHHVQSDHDFLVCREDLKRANDIFVGLGYEGLDSHSRFNVDHLPALIKSSGWEWKGNYYDPEIPTAIELHFRLWDSEFEGIAINSLEKVWQNSIVREIGGIRIPLLSRQDALTYAVMHAFRHLLRNDLRLSHLYELAFFLNHNVTDTPFWNTFGEELEQFPTSLKVTATMFHLARKCFEPKMSPFVQELVTRNLSAASELWIEKYGRKEALSSYRQSKNSLFLHLDFFENQDEILSRILTRLLPSHLPPKYLGVKISDDRKTLLQRLHEGAYFFWQICTRSVFHISELLGFLWKIPLWELSLSKLQRRPEEVRFQENRDNVGAEGGT